MFGARKIYRALVFTTCLLAGGGAAAQHTNHDQNKAGAHPPAQCLQEGTLPSVMCAEAPTPTVDGHGRWWLTWTQQGHVYVASAHNPADGFTRPVRVTQSAMHVDKNGENRPKAVVAENGDVYVSFTAKGKREYTGVIYFSRSLDGGKTYSAPRPVTDEAEPGSQRFDTIAVTSSGRIYMAWLDKRDLFAAKNNGQVYRGAALYYTWSDDRGASFAPNTKVADHSCECCRTAMALDGETPVVVWRHVFAPNIRDHMVIRLNTNNIPVRLSDDHWAIDGCPHHGPAISITNAGVQHVVWYTDGEVRSGLFHARSDDGGKSFSAPSGFGATDRQASHPHVLAIGKTVFLAWKEFTGEESELYVSQSADAGRTWSVPLRVAQTPGPSDHPFLIHANGWVHVSWTTMIEGWRSMRIAPLVDSH
ncbi:MAG: exo-alpha-sialidase [Rhodospirillales bacterium]|jgi:hypothetical protein|nr:exo-alpha-sialidase [Rhodospirillales bacterium]MBT4039803.1 exo-alpha-sialidase [Rhodospirillales bacterium]MBT4627473.1 exo-alpha-sialidase [Rhodospirillales bacterium]MBT5350808.1 exo-alpha-sialidase [Rhodospirillales bacterium]MBT5519748.1 exo-alpha-sialidase [Rhodospirillales bacterium]